MARSRAELDPCPRQLHPVVIHAHLGYDGVMAIPLARRLRIPLVTTFHGSDVTLNDEALHNLGGRYHLYVQRRESLKREGRLFIAVSEFIRGLMLARGWPEDKIVVHHIGVDTELFRPDPTVAREPIVLFAGRLIPVKGVAHLIAAMREVQTRIPEAELVIAGQGRLQGELERQAKELDARVRFLGTIPLVEMRGWMNRARVLCIPSITARTGHTEAFPTVAIEAQSMGLPVVGFASGGISEAVINGQTGLLGPERDRAALAANIEASNCKFSSGGRLGSMRARVAASKQASEFETHAPSATSSELRRSTVEPDETKIARPSRSRPPLPAMMSV
ncbi:MAG: glycosyltransferase [Pyrinomonadaceae bacterium]